MKTNLVTDADELLPDPAVVKEFFQATLDCLPERIAILCGDGNILFVNAAWVAFETRDGFEQDDCGPGANYFEVCRRTASQYSSDWERIPQAIRDISQDFIPSFQLEYACHATPQPCWFSLRVTRFVIDSQIRIVVTHENITERKLAEIRLSEANRRLEAQASTDGLTGVANRRRFDDALAQEWERHVCREAPLSLLLFDIDDFKPYNDTCGHLAGDDCLREVAQTMQSMVRRPVDLLARYGGDEFAVILPETDRVGSLGLAETISEALRRRRMPHPASGVAPFVTMSIGCATMIPTREISTNALVQRADRALYQAKAEGRDRVIHFFSDRDAGPG